MMDAVNAAYDAHARRLTTWLEPGALHEGAARRFAEDMGLALAAAALIGVKERLPGHSPLLYRAMKDADSRVRHRALQAWARPGPTPDLEQLHALASRDPDQHVKCEALITIGSQGPAARSLVPFLLTALGDPDARYGQLACDCFTRVASREDLPSPPPPELEPKLVGFFEMVEEDEDGNVSVVEIKTASRKWSAGQVAMDLQGSL